MDDSKEHKAKSEEKSVEDNISKDYIPKGKLGNLPVQNDLSEAKKDYKVLSIKGKIPASKSPIEVLPEKKQIIVHEGHPSFVEKLNVCEREFGNGVGDDSKKSQH